MCQNGDCPGLAISGLCSVGGKFGLWFVGDGRYRLVSGIILCYLCSSTYLPDKCSCLGHHIIQIKSNEYLKSPFPDIVELAGRKVHEIFRFAFVSECCTSKSFIIHQLGAQAVCTPVLDGILHQLFYYYVTTFS